MKLDKDFRWLVRSWLGHFGPTLAGISRFKPGSSRGRVAPMVSGVFLFVALFNNLAIFIALVAVYGILIGNVASVDGSRRQLATGLAFGLFAVGCMHAQIPVYHGVIVDQRNAVVALSGAFGGPWSALISALLAGSYRAHLGGAGVLSGITGIALAASSGGLMNRLRGRPTNVRSCARTALICTLVILPGFLLVGTWRTGWELMLSMAVPYGTAILIGMFLVGLLLAREDSRHRADVRFRQMVDMASEAIIVIDESMNVRLFNAKAEFYSGVHAEHVVGRPLAELTWLDASVCHALTQWASSSRRARVSMTPLETEMRSADLVFEVSVGSFFDIAGEREWVIVFRDITARRHAEDARAAYESRILQSKSLEALGRLAGGVAHDFNNMLTVIVGTVDLLKFEQEDNKELERDLQNIGEAASKAAELTAQLLAFGRKQVLEPQVLQPNDVILALQPLLRRSLPESIELFMDCAPELSNVRVDAARLEQVLVNLAVNARDAMPQGGCVTIRTRDRLLDEAYAAEHPEVIPGEYVEISVVDTGMGMTHEVRARIFEPFFTTKPHSKGTGLGLATVHGIVRQSGGHLEVSSEVGFGSTFHVYLPKSDAEISSLSLESVPSQQRFRGNVLLVEDSDLVRGPIRRMLQALGFRVVEAACAKEALSVYLAAEEAIDLVLTDIVLRDQSGVELALAIRAHHADARVVFMSGYTDNPTVHQGLLDPEVNFISKPFTIRSLRAAIAQVLVRRSKQPPRLAHDNLR